MWPQECHWILTILGKHTDFFLLLILRFHMQRLLVMMRWVPHECDVLNQSNIMWYKANRQQVLWRFMSDIKFTVSWAFKSTMLLIISKLRIWLFQFLKHRIKQSNFSLFHKLPSNADTKSSLCLWLLLYDWPRGLREWNTSHVFWCLHLFFPFFPQFVFK